MQDVVALDVVRQRERHALGHAAEHDRGARECETADRVAMRSMKSFDALANLQPDLVHDLLALAPGQHEERDDEGDEQREPAAVEELRRGRGEEQEVESEQAAVDRHRRCSGLCFQCSATNVAISVVITISSDTAMPNAPASASEEPKPMTAVKRADGERPVDERDIDLADLAAFGMNDVHARQKAEMDRLLGQRIGAGDDRLGGDHGRDRRQDDKRIMRPLRRELRRTGCRGRPGLARQQQAALAEIIEGQRRQRHAEPGDADRQRAEMAHVGVERLAPGHRQERAADDDESQRPGMPEIGDRRPAD